MFAIATELKRGGLRRIGEKIDDVISVRQRCLHQLAARLAVTQSQYRKADMPAGNLRRDRCAFPLNTPLIRLARYICHFIPICHTHPKPARISMILEISPRFQIWDEANIFIRQHNIWLHPTCLPFVTLFTFVSSAATFLLTLP